MKSVLWKLIKNNTDCMMASTSVRDIAYFKGKVDAYLVAMITETSCTEKDYETASRIVDKLYEKKMLFYT